MNSFVFSYFQNKSYSSPVGGPSVMWQVDCDRFYVICKHLLWTSKLLVLQGLESN